LVVVFVVAAVPVVAAAVLPMFFKTLCDDVDFAGGWLHERGPAGVEVSRDRRRRQKLETN
jgi:hypothetical protein